MEKEDIFGLLRADIGEEGVAKQLEQERRKLKRKKKRLEEQMRMEMEALHLEEQRALEAAKHAQQEERTGVPETEKPSGASEKQATETTSKSAKGVATEKPKTQESSKKQSERPSKGSDSAKLTPAASLKAMPEPPAEVHGHAPLITKAEPEEAAPGEPIQSLEGEQGAAGWEGADQFPEWGPEPAEGPRAKDPEQEEARRMLVSALVILAALLVLVLVALFVYTKPFDVITNRTLKVLPCSSQGCMSAKELSESMRLTTKSKQGKELHPCDDFYLYACGGWASSQPLETSVLERLNSRLVVNMNRTLSNANIEAGEHETYRNLIIFYRSCIDFHTNPMPAGMRVRKALYLLDLSFTEWLEHNQDPIFLFFFIVRLSLSKGINTILTLSVIEKNRQARVVLKVGHAIRTKFYDSAARAFVERDWMLYISDALFSLGVSDITKDVAKSTLAWDNYMYEKSREAYNTMTFERTVADLLKLQKNVSVDDWMEAINDNLPITLHLKNNSYLDAHRLDIVGEVITTFFSKEKVELVTYVFMQAIAELLHFDFNRKYKPVTTCLIVSYHNFYDPMVSLFVKKHLTPSITTSFKTFFENIKEGVNQSAPSFDWMDETTRVKARVKVNSASLKIVESTIREVNADEEQMTSDFMANYVRIAAYNQQRANRYPEPENKKKASLDLLVGSVTVDYKDTVLSVPATSLLEPVLYENVREKFVNLSAIGSVLASEIVSVAFSPQGSMYAAGGLQMRWWPERVYNTYDQRLQCYETEYYRLEKDFVVSSNASTGARLHDDVAEFLMTYTRGLEIAYAMADIKDNYNAQLFFQRFCQQFCDSNAGKPTAKRANLNVKLACMFPLVHNQGFRKTFACEHTHMLYPKANCARL